MNKIGAVLKFLTYKVIEISFATLVVFAWSVLILGGFFLIIFLLIDVLL